MATAAPPSAELVEAALAGGLDTPLGRKQAMKALLESGADRVRARIVRVIQEWLGTDRMSATAKDSNVYRDFDAVKQPFERESSEFIAEVLLGSTGTVGELLHADYTYSSGTIEAPLAQLYGVSSAQGRIRLDKRRGILNQGAFLAVFAHAHESAPVLRGVTIGRRVACLPIGSPTALNIVVTPPLPDPSKTTRQRFDVHSQDVDCRGCHDIIDPLGFAFEHYDGMGKFRTTDGPPVDSQVSVALGSDFDGDYADSDALAQKLAESAQVRECFARHLFRASIGRSDPLVDAAEQEFVRTWQALWALEDPAVQANAADQGNFARILLSLVETANFGERLVNP
jgi:hypothetical protein